MSSTLEKGLVRVGYVTEDIEEGHYEPCVLQMEDDGVRARVPVLHKTQPNEHADRWHRSQTFPESLIYSDNEGTVVLHDTRWRGTKDGMVGGSVEFDAEVTIFGQPQHWPVRKEVAEFRSRFDALEDFKFFPRVNTDWDHSAVGLTTTVEVSVGEQETWTFGGFTYFLDGTAPSTGIDGKSFSVETETWLRTTSENGATAQDHLTAQWPVRALISLVQGHGLYWREHMMQDPEFDHPAGRMEHEVHLGRTIRERQQPTPKHNPQPLFRYDDLGPDGMVKWLTLMDHETFARAIDPAAGMLTDRPTFLEVRVLLEVMALDAMGQFHHGDRTFHTLHPNLMKCLDRSGIDLSPLGTHEDVATAISNLNNEVKHANRDRPDGMALSLATDLLLALFRSQIFGVLDLPDALRVAFASNYRTVSAVTDFGKNNFGIVGSGREAKFGPTT